MRNIFPKIAILTPFILMLLWVGYQFMPMMYGMELRLPIQGYDPRDLLSGHYLRFRVDYGIPVCEQPNAEQCVCFTNPEQGKNAKATWAGNCTDKPASCEISIKGTCQYKYFDAGIERFYIPETNKIQSISKDASVVLKVYKGKSAIQDIEINGQSISE